MYSNDTLCFWNRVAASLHLVQFCIMAIAAVQVPGFRDFRVPVTYAHYVMGVDGLKSETGQFGVARVAFFIPPFFLLSAVFQGLTTVGRFNRIYNADLDRGVNRFRWYEYALSSGIMICLIASFVGITDLCALINIFVVNACMNLFGMSMELSNSGQGVNWLPFVYGCIAACPPWISIFTSLALGGSPPDFVYAIFVTYFVMFSLFPANMVLYFVRVGPWREYRFGEYVYIMLSLTAKTVLGWMVFGGLNAPNEFVT
jgi:hypothetical protein